MIDVDMCFGCGACSAICHSEAIVLKNGICGAYIPVVDAEKCVNCGRCKEVCSYNECNIIHNGMEEQEYYSVYSSEEICMKSASGGAFRSIAEYVIKDGGIVYGAAYDTSSNDVRHRSAADMEGLEALCGSKYVQSFIAADIYRSVKKELESGRKVLYSGTPCQVAGLVRYLGKKYEQLYTADIVCHGVPSASYWKKYLYELDDKKTVSKVCFRSKEKQTNAMEGYRLSVEYDDGTVTEIPTEKCFYYMAYFSGLSLSSVCTGCRFAAAERTGDITLGDLIPENGHQHLNPKGNSLVIINSCKGRKLFDEVSRSDERMTVRKIAQREAVIMNHSLYKPSYEAAGAAGFRRDIEEMSFEKAVKKNIGTKYDVLLFMPFYSGKPENVFRTLAVYYMLKEWGMTAVLTELPLQLRSSDSNAHYKKNYIQRLIYRNCPVLPPLNDIRYSIKLTQSARMFVLADEPLWEYSEADKWHLFSYAGDNISRIVLGADFSERLKKCSNDLREEFYDLLYLFDGIFVSDASMSERLSDILDMETELLPELLFLRDADFYYSFFGDLSAAETELLYVADNEILSDPDKCMSDIRGAETVFTNSYFAAVLCILSGKNFFVSSEAPDRLLKMMKGYGLGGRILSDDAIPDTDKSDICSALEQIKKERSVLLSKIRNSITECLKK